MQRPIGGAEMDWLAIEALGVPEFAITKRCRRCDHFRLVQPILEERWLNMQKNAFAELLNGRQPFDAPGEVGAIYVELDFVEFALG